MLFVRGDGVILVRTSHILGAAKFKLLHAGFPAIEVMMFYLELKRTVRSQSVYFYQLEQTRDEVGQSRTRRVLLQPISMYASFQGFAPRFLRSLCLCVCALLCVCHPRMQKRPTACADSPRPSTPPRVISVSDALLLFLSLYRFELSPVSLFIAKCASR